MIQLVQEKILGDLSDFEVFDHFQYKFNRNVSSRKVFAAYWL